MINDYCLLINVIRIFRFSDFQTTGIGRLEYRGIRILEWRKRPETEDGRSSKLKAECSKEERRPKSGEERNELCVFAPLR